MRRGRWSRRSNGRRTLRGADLAPYGGVGLAALRGRETEAAYLIERTRTEVTSRGEGIGLSVLGWAGAVLYNGLGRYKEAREAALGRRRRTTSTPLCGSWPS